MIKQLDIPFVALKQGIHNFSFEVENAFFEAFPYSIIDEGFISVELSLDKKDTLMVGDYKIFGSVVSTCATCNDVVEVPINGTMTLYYKFGLEKEDDENLIVLPPEAYKFNPAQQIYELITVSLTSNPKHEEGECNEEVVSLIKSYQRGIEKSDDIDPRWDQLNKLN
ncbi:MAG: YceD family protein [Crocinitomicaceae bacterium]|jgi:uncharacterized metal-binding protein YceD (DUF177 family)|tara:strand:+ start:3923 stop:4423 length:501 start_codon:yes stop_codon:yes gene_type:complete